jgi:hypothetical protein
MVLKYLDFEPLPNQAQLAAEMHTDINQTTKWEYTYIPFEKRGFSNFYNESLSKDFKAALSNLKGNVSQNFPAIVCTWYNEESKVKGNITHARVVTGYNSTGIFVHDPLDGPNKFLNYSTFASLWETRLGYWALIIRHEPTFNLIVEVKDLFGFPISGVEIKIEDRNIKKEVTDFNGTVRFSNLTIGNYVVGYEWKFESQKDIIRLPKTVKKSYMLLLSDATLSATIIVIFIIVVIAVVFGRKRHLKIKSISKTF